MKSFFKIFFASLLAMIVFLLLGLFLIVGAVGSLASKDKPEVADKTVLVLDLSQALAEQRTSDPFATLQGGEDVPGLYDAVRLIRHAAGDAKVSGILLQANGSGNGYAASHELREALIAFRRSGKFLLAYGDIIPQGAYYIASAAERVYLNPAGALDWSGYSVDIPFVKGTLDKLEIKPQIFYAGKFKSATEPLRVTEMTPENKLQTADWLGDLYGHFLAEVGAARKLDTAALHRLANTAAIQTPTDAQRARLVDGLRYDDQVKDEIKQRLKVGKWDKVSFLSLAKYSEAVSIRKTGSSRIALIYAQGDIVDGEGTEENIGGERFRALVRRARLDQSVKAIVLRVNSGGGSALASEIIWREIEKAKEDKPVVVSFGDVAASGGYYIAAGADSIFAEPNTITGSIGVFGIIPNMEGFFRNKLGITFDGVKTAPYADLGAVYRPLSAQEAALVQASVDRIYTQFKTRVAQGRKKDIAFIDSIAQGRVYSGSDALRLGLVDRLGSIDDALRAAARLAKLDDYGIREYPEAENWWQNLLNSEKKTTPAALIRKELGEEQYKVYRQLIRLREMTGSIQARLPYEPIFD